jgi:hypothetical protein
VGSEVLWGLEGVGARWGGRVGLMVS